MYGDTWPCIKSLMLGSADRDLAAIFAQPVLQPDQQTPLVLELQPPPGGVEVRL